MPESYPLHWPNWIRRRDPSARQKSRFHSGWGASLTTAAALERLRRVILGYTRCGQSWVIDPDQVIVSTNVPVRRDGLPRSGARPPDDPGVCVWLNIHGEPHAFPCDKWTTVADNIAAIAAHLDAKRAMDRWGVGDVLSEFRGYRALEHEPDRSSWRTVLGIGPDSDIADAKIAYRSLRSIHHPDRGGNADQFAAITAAWEQAQQELAPE